MSDEEIRIAPPSDPLERSQRLSRPELPKRFYKGVAVGSGENGHAITLDGRTVRTPGGRVLAAPDATVAEAIAAEWAAQAERIDRATMPLTRLLNSTIDGVEPAREAVARDIAAYAQTDLLCYRADGPGGLVDNQRAAWDPILAWAETTLGARFVLAEGVMPVAQSASTLSAVDARLPRDPALLLAAMHSMTSLTGSVLIALAVLEGQLDAEEAWAAAHVDEDWNISLWGEDAEAKRRRDQREIDMQAAAFVVRALA
ncbi:ATP12 family chaperone protein [Amorphus sp. 3PC139-8]|uniref:ATP12 family chaperone protein n=1 Tax=Amorphus sp. 3PC139-8 TaxID=2735676 RepID=UPI00345DD612